MTDEEVRAEIALRTHCSMEILGGDRVFRGTRIIVDHVGGLALKGIPLQELLEDFPRLNADDIELARRFVAIEPQPARDPNKRLRFIRMARPEVAHAGKS